MSSLKTLYVSNNPLDNKAKSVLKKLKKKEVDVVWSLNQVLIYNKIKSIIVRRMIKLSINELISEKNSQKIEQTLLDLSILEEEGA